MLYKVGAYHPFALPLTKSQMLSRFPLLLCLPFFFPLTSSISLVLEVHRGNYTSKHLSWLHYRRGRQEGGKGRMLEKRWGLKLDEYKALVMVAFINDSQQLSVGLNYLHVSVYLTFLRCPEHLHDDGKPFTFTFVFFFFLFAPEQGCTTCLRNITTTKAVTNVW